MNRKKDNMLKAINLLSYLPKGVKIVSNSQKRFYGLAIKGKNIKYIEYYHLIPKDMPKELWKNEWLDSSGNLKDYGRFRFKGNINRKSSPLSPEEMLAAVKHALSEEGFNPFDEIMQVVKEMEEPVHQLAILAPIKQPKGISLEEALNKFMGNYPEFIVKNKKKKKNPTWEHNLGTKTMLLEYFKDRKDEPILTITSNDLKACFKAMEEARGWKKSSYNDRMRKVKTFYNFLVKEEHIEKSPAVKLELKTKVSRTKHKYYDQETLKLVFDKMNKHPDRPMADACLQFFSAIYYTCTRPIEETQQLECGDINWNDKTIYIDPERAKGGAGGFIPLDPKFAKMLKKMGVDKCPGNYIVFGEGFKPAPVGLKANIFSDWFRDEIRRPNNLDESYTPYGMKHTRIRDLYFAGIPIAQIQRYCRHASPSMTEKYLRELGCLVDQSITKKSTRKL